MYNKHTQDLIDDWKKQNTNEINAADELCLALIYGILRQLDKYTHEAVFVLTELSIRCEPYSQVENTITQDLISSFSAWDMGRYGRQPPEQLDALLAYKKNLIQAMQGVVPWVQQEPEDEEEQKEDILAALLLKENDLFLFFHTPRFGDSSLKEIVVYVQSCLRDCLLYRARINKAAASIEYLSSAVNQINISLLKLLLFDPYAE